MGNQKQKWTADEEDALNRGVQKYGAGKWKNILKDPDFAPFLITRSNIDLKDKWRNLNVSNGLGGPKDKSRTPKSKGIASSSSPTSVPALLPPPVVTPTQQGAVSAPQTQIVAVDDPSSKSEDAKNPPRYSAMVFEALSTIKDPNGSDISAIARFIEQKHKVPQNFRRALSTRLRRLVSQGKLEKVQNCFKIKKDTPLGMKSPPPKTPPRPNDGCPLQSPDSSFLASSQTLKEAAEVAAYRVADAQNKEILAAEAAKEAERLSKLAEESQKVLELVTEMCERGLRGEVVGFPFLNDI